MIPQKRNIDCSLVASNDSSRVIHDLRAPINIATGYLDELRTFKLQLLKQLSSVNHTESSEELAEQISKDTDVEMSLCLDMIGEALEELDHLVSDLRKYL